MKTSVLLAALAALAAPALADTVTLAPAANTTTNALALYSGDTAVEITGPGTVKLNPGNIHTGGTTLSGGTLVLSGDFEPTLPSPVGMGTFTVAGGTLRGTGTFGHDIAGTDLAAIEAPGGWTWTGINTFANTNAITDGILTIASGTNAFSSALYICRTTDGPSGLRVTGGTVTVGDRLHLGSPAPTGAGDLPASFEQTGGTVTMGGNLQLGFSDSKYGKTTFTMTGGTFNANGKNIVSGYQTTYTTNTVDVSGTAVLAGAANFYAYQNTGNQLDVNVHDGGTLGITTSLYNGSTSSKTYLRVNGGVLRNDKSGSASTTLVSGWIGNSSESKRLTSFTIGPKGVTFRAKNGNASGVAQVYSPMTSEPAGEGETAAGVTVASGRFAYYVAMDYEGPTTIKNGAFLYLSLNGQLPAASPVTVEGGGMLRLMSANKTIPALTLEEGASLGFGTPSEGANTSTLTVSGNLVLPASAKIALYTKNTVDGSAKSDDGTYAVLKAPAAYANALRAVKWTCSSLGNGKTAVFSVTEENDIATLAVTISDAPASGANVVYAADTQTKADGNLSVDCDIDLYGTLLVGGSVSGSASGGSLTVHNGGVLDVSSGNITTSADGSAIFDLYLEDGGSIFVKNIQDSANTWESSAFFHFNGGTLYPVYGRITDGPDNGGYQMILNYQYATLGEYGLTIDLSRWVRPADYAKWVRISIQGKVNHDPDCVGADGGIVIRGGVDEKVVVMFGGRFSGSTLNGGIRVEDGCIVAPYAQALIDQTLTIEPGARLRPFFNDANNPVSAQVGTLTLGAVGATKPVALDTSNKSKLLGCYVVSNSVSVLSPVEFGTCANWATDNVLATGTFTTLVYKATSTVDPTLFQLPAEAVAAGYTLSAEEVPIVYGGDSNWKALVCKVSATGISANDLVITGSASYPSPVTVSSDTAYASIVVGGTYGGEADPCGDTSLTISGNVTASKALYLGYNPAPGVDQYHPHQGFLTIGSGASLSVPAVYSVYRTSPIDTTQNPRYGCELTVDGGQLNVSGDVQFGHQVSKSGDKLYSQLTVDHGGRVAVGGTFYLYYYQHTANTGVPGCIVLNDGEVDVTGPVDLSRNSKVNTKTGGVHYDSILYHFGLYLNGGILKAETIKMTDSAAIPKVYFNGGTFMPYGKTAANRTMQNLNVAYVSAGGAKVSTENLSAGATYTIAQPLLTDPALSGAADGGFTKKGAGILSLTGANTFTGPVAVEQGALIAGSDALPASPFSATVADGAVLVAEGEDLSLVDLTASGTIVANSVTVSDTLTLAGEDSFLSVAGDLTLERSAAIDFGLGEGERVSATWIPVAAASGTVTVPTSLSALNAGEKNRCLTKVVDGVLYICPTRLGTVLTIL